MYNDEIIRDDEPMKVLMQSYQGTKYEWLFLGKFSDRVHTFDPNITPVNPFWPTSPIHTESETAEKILQTLICIVSSVIEIANNTNEYQSLMRYFDAHVPLM